MPKEMSFGAGHELNFEFVNQGAGVTTIQLIVEDGFGVAQPFSSGRGGI